MIFIIDNNQKHSDHQLYFVKADPHFQDWWTHTVLEFLKKTEGSDGLPSIVASSSSITWRGKDASMSPDELVDRLVPFYEENPPVYRKVARPRIGSRVSSKDGKRGGAVEGSDMRSRRPMVLWDGTHYALPVALEDLRW